MPAEAVRAARETYTGGSLSKSEKATNEERTLRARSGDSGEEDGERS